MSPNSWWKAVFVAGFFAAIAAPRLCAQDRDTCLHFFGNSSRPERFECISALFSQEPIHATIGNIAPSNGFPIGLVIGKELNSARSQNWSVDERNSQPCVSSALPTAPGERAATLIGFPACCGQRTQKTVMP